MTRDISERPVRPADATSRNAPQARFLRRSAVVDMALRPESLDGPLMLVGVARDLYTDRTGHGHEVDSAAMTLSIDFAADRTVRSVATSPPTEGVEQLTGLSASRGFRARLQVSAIM